MTGNSNLTVAALWGVNLILAWVGYEKILLDTLQHIGLTEQEILPFFSGPAFQAWNRLGNTQGDSPNCRARHDACSPCIPWLRTAGYRSRSAACDLGECLTAVALPAESHRSVLLSPLDDTFSELQMNVISRQMQTFGNATHVYALDQFKEDNLASGTRNTCGNYRFI
ncbi:hypothetical protein BDV23DRAFT_178606 [Aspergillus alliaceus]|uniref:Alpha-N-acetylglucosaminidase tim-barrel domain-containing protein n=1 Tax=Petromyces alliaceus TaxID=209559 RepID=A0A5N7CN25_PETAA|nr:hypothetical protein BDV23DRAFT_178606 [Aspergillus alliaceus]